MREGSRGCGVLTVSGNKDLTREASWPKWWSGVSGSPLHVNILPDHRQSPGRQPSSSSPGWKDISTAREDSPGSSLHAAVPPPAAQWTPHPSLHHSASWELHWWILAFLVCNSSPFYPLKRQLHQAIASNLCRWVYHVQRCTLWQQQHEGGGDCSCLGAKFY